MAQSQLKGPPRMKNCMGETKRRVGARRTQFGGSGFARVMRSSRVSDAASGARRMGVGRRPLVWGIFQIAAPRIFRVPLSGKYQMLLKNSGVIRLDVCLRGRASALHQIHPQHHC